MSNNLRAYRVKRIMTQKDLSEASGISQVTISFIENELSQPMDLTAIKLCRALKTPVRNVFPDLAARGIELSEYMKKKYGEVQDENNLQI